MKKSWVLLWFYALRLNSDYERYCRLKRHVSLQTPQSEKHERIINALELKFPKIREIYGDWGDLYVDTKGNRAQFKQWLSSHRKLFFPQKVKSVRVLVNGPSLEGETLLAISKDFEKETTLEQIEELLDELLSKRARQSPKPKYSIYPIGRLNDGQVVALYKTLKVAHLAKLKKLGKEQLKTNFDIVKRIILERDMYWAWEFADADIENLKAGKLKRLDVQDQLRQVLRYRKQSAIIIKNTLLGIFPYKDRLL